MKATAHQPPKIARANGIELCYEIFGDAGAEPVLLIMGLAAQMIHWDEEFCRQLAARGFRVIRFDNRDIGKSSRMTGGKRLTPFELLKLRFLKIPVAAPYTLLDMAKDTIGLMDVLGIKSAHLVGASMGGMIEGSRAPPVRHTTPLRRGGQHCRRRFAASALSGSLLRREKPCHRVLIAIPSATIPGEQPR